MNDVIVGEDGRVIGVGCDVSGSAVGDLCILMVYVVVKGGVTNLKCAGVAVYIGQGNHIYILGSFTV